jgi:alkylation response protein AidB-like acyl-CoA dehydrogenase
MDLLPDHEQSELAATVAGFVRRTNLRRRARDLRGAPVRVTDEEWRSLADLGLLSLGIAQVDGGVGLGPVEEVLAFRELGRELVPGPILPSVLGAHLAASEGHADITGDIMRGDRRIGLIVAPAHLLRSTEVLLVDARDTDLLIRVTPTSAALFNAAHVVQDRVTVDPLDPSASVERARWTGDRPIVESRGADGGVYLRGLLLASAMLTGIAEACRDAATSHAKTRTQFGRPIGVNQAIKHACADMAVAAEAALAQLLYAAGTAAIEEPDAAFQAAVAKVVASEAAVGNAEANVQVRGGMGFTWEDEAHLYVKRARAWAQLLGARAEVLRSVLEQQVTGGVR